MKKYVILTDSSCDLSKETRAKYDIEYLPMHFSFDSATYDADLDWKTFTQKEFYDLMRNGKRIITSQVTSSEYKVCFEKYIKEGYDILSLSCSSGLSASVNASYVARDEVLKEYPDAKILCIDALISCCGLGILSIIASQLRAEGKSIEETAEWIEKNKMKLHQEGVVDNLKYLKQAGRVSAASAFFGGMLNIKPIIIADGKGCNEAVEKVKGRKKSIERLVERVVAQYQSNERQRIFIVHGDCIEECQELKNKLVERLPDKDVEVNIEFLGPIIGASCGPGTLGVYFIGTEREKNVEKE